MPILRPVRNYDVMLVDAISRPVMSNPPPIDPPPVAPPPVAHPVIPPYTYPTTSTVIIQPFTISTVTRIKSVTLRLLLSNPHSAIGFELILSILPYPGPVHIPAVDAYTDDKGNYHSAVAAYDMPHGILVRSTAIASAIMSTPSPFSHWPYSDPTIENDTVELSAYLLPGTYMLVIEAGWREYPASINTPGIVVDPYTTYPIRTECYVYNVWNSVRPYSLFFDFVYEGQVI